VRFTFLFYAAIMALIGVAMGAFGAHALKSSLTAQQLDIYKTAVSYQMWHALALAMISMLPDNKFLRWAGYLLLSGIVLFCGSLYMLSIFNSSGWGMVTPFGGLAFLSAWALIAYAALQLQRNSKP
jgi:uncharacterized membrane protein YgdD (TMEM256/DUF423 family)